MHGFTADDREDLEQELALDLLRRLPRFDPARASKNTFISRIVDHAVATIIERQEASSRDYRVPTVSLDDVVTDEAGLETSRSEVLDAAAYLRQTCRQDFRSPEDHDLAIDLKYAVRSLPPELQELFGLCSDCTVTEISQLTGIPRSTIYERLAKLRAYFERAGLKQYLS